jgi:hypothetical protein
MNRSAFQFVAVFAFGLLWMGTTGPGARPGPPKGPVLIAIAIRTGPFPFGPFPFGEAFQLPRR